MFIYKYVNNLFRHSNIKTLLQQQKKTIREEGSTATSTSATGATNATDSTGATNSTDATGATNATDATGATNVRKDFKTPSHGKCPLGGYPPPPPGGYGQDFSVKLAKKT